MTAGKWTNSATFKLTAILRCLALHNTKQRNILLLGILYTAGLAQGWAQSDDVSFSTQGQSLFALEGNQRIEESFRAYLINLNESDQEGEIRRLSENLPLSTTQAIW